MEKFKIDTLAKIKVKRLADFLNSFLLKYRNIQNAIQSSLEVFTEESKNSPWVEGISSLINQSLNELHDNLEDSELLFRDITLRTSSFSLNELFGVLKGELESLCLEKKIIFKIHIDPNDSSFGDVTLLKRCFTHLIKNSIKALSLKSKNEEKVIILKGSKGGKQIEVLDNGPGFPQQILEEVSLFEKKQTNNFEFGLGIPYVSEVIKAHGGKVIFSKENLWTIVSISLP